MITNPRNSPSIGGFGFDPMAQDDTQNDFNYHPVAPSLSAGAGQIPGQYSNQFTGDYFNNMNNVGQQIQQQYQYQTPTANAAQMNTGAVPQPGAQQYHGSSQLEQLLSGQGFDPATLARMHANQTDQISQNGMAQMGQTRRALGQAGLSQSPAGMAIQADQSRQTAQAQNTGYNDIEMANANVGNQNRQFGVGQQTSIGVSNMEQANQMALANANRLFDALSLNTKNAQQTNLANAGAQQSQMSDQAGAVSKHLGDMNSQWGKGALDKQTGADTTNAFNTRATNEFNANNAQGANFFNTGNQEARYGNAVKQLGNAGFSALNG